MSWENVLSARKDACTRIEASGSTVVEELSTNHEEADTKLVHLLEHAIDNAANVNRVVFIVRSSLGDVDVPIILLSYEIPADTSIILDSGRHKFRKVKSLDDYSLSDIQKKALIGLHVLTGYDQNSSFLRKGKLSCWEVLEENPYLLDAFVELGSQTNVSDDFTHKIQDFVCKLIVLLSCLGSLIEWGGGGNSRGEWKFLKNLIVGGGV